jgi:signal transduction histidine kinase
MGGTEVDDQGPVLARAFSDAQDRLISADEPLAGLQRSCGGELPGAIAVPALLDLVRKARQYRFRLARTINAQDGGEAITAWVEVEPQGDDEPGEEGCRIIMRSWRSAPLPVDDAGEMLERRTLVDREVAELSARLDANQHILTVASDSAELRDLAATMEAGIGRPFTDFLAPEACGPQVLHWRMLDGAPVRVEGSPRDWRIVLLPWGQPGSEPSGFELLLVSDEPPPLAGLSSARKVSGPVPAGRAIVGADLAPVLRQPISRIVANAETIRTRLAGPLPDAYADYAAEIANAGRLLLGLLEDLSDLEVVESASFTTEPDPIDLAEVARQAAGILGVRAREKEITVAAPQPGEQLPATAEFRRVLQILINLVGNAIRYSPEGSHIAITLEREGDLARVIVADQGPGLSQEDQAIVFEKFERLGRSGDGGSGLGLYISRRLARAMVGELRVDSMPGEGARFILEVPADTANLPR